MKSLAFIEARTKYAFVYAVSIIYIFTDTKERPKPLPIFPYPNSSFPLWSNVFSPPFPGLIPTGEFHIP